MDYFIPGKNSAQYQIAESFNYKHNFYKKNLRVINPLLINSLFLLPRAYIIYAKVMFSVVSICLFNYHRMYHSLLYRMNTCDLPTIWTCSNLFSWGPFHYINHTRCPNSFLLSLGRFKPHSLST